MIKTDLKKGIAYAGILLIGTLYFKENINSIALIIFSVLVLAYILIHKDAGHLRGAFISSLPLLLYFLLAFTGFLVNSESNVDYLVRLLPFLLAPLFMYYFRHLEKGNRLVNTFIAANILFLLFLDLLAIEDMISSKSLFVLADGNENYRFLYTRLTAGYFNHIYLSAYSLLSVALLLQFKPVKNKWALFSSLAFLLLNIGLLGSRAVVIGMILASSLYAISMVFINRKNIKYLLVFLAVSLLATGLIYRFKDTLLFNRYAQVFEWYENQDLILERNYSINNRIKLYFVGFSMFEDYHRYGINGTGLASDAIAHKYETEFSDEFKLNTNTYNAHNQFITNFIDWGLAGLMLTIFILLIPIRASFRSKEYWVAFYWISLSVILLMESALIRHRGIVVFVLFYSLFSLPKPTTADEPR